MNTGNARLPIGFDAEEVATMSLGPHAAWAMMDRTPRWAALLAVLSHRETFPRTAAWLERWALGGQVTPPRGDEAADALALLDEAREELVAGPHELAETGSASPTPIRRLVPERALGPERFAEMREAVRTWIR